MSDNPDEFWKTLDELGAAEVRKRLASNVWAEKRREMAQAWLQNDTQLRLEDAERRSSSSTEEQMRIARRANTIATIAAIAATVGAIASIMTFYLSGRSP